MLRWCVPLQSLVDAVLLHSPYQHKVSKHIQLGAQVRFVFENATELASVPAGQELDQERIAQAGVPAQNAPALQTEASAQGVLTALYSVAEDQGNEIASICRYWPVMLLLSLSLRPLVYSTEHHRAYSMHKLNPQRVPHAGTGQHLCLHQR